MTRVDEARARALVERLLDQGVVGWQAQSGFASNTVATATLASGDRVVFKAADPHEVAVEAWALRSVAQIGLPVPELLTASTSGTGYLLTRFVTGAPGVPTTDDATRAGDLLREVHRLPVTGAGFFKEGAPPPPAAPAGSWAEVVAETGERLAPLVEAGVLTPVLARRCRRVLEDRPRWDQPVVFVHGDLHQRHLLGLGTSSEAVIDWADCGAASPWLDLARLDLGDRFRRAFLTAYFEGQVPSDAEREIDAHQLLHQLLALVWEHEGGGDWLHERVPGIELALRRL